MTQSMFPSVKTGKDIVSVCAVNVALIAAIWGVAMIMTGGGEGEDVTAPGFAAFNVPLSQQIYLQISMAFGWSGVVLPIASLLLVRKFPDPRIIRAMRALIFVLLALGAASLISWIIAQISVSQHVDRFKTRDADVSAAFNEYYCNARGTAICETQVETPEQLKSLVQVFGGGGNDSATMTNVFLSCQYLFITNMGGLSSVQRGFLRGCNTSEAVDQWCGDLILSTLNVGVASNSSRASNNTAASPPSSINSAKFDHFVAAWLDHLVYDIVLLSFVDILVVALWCTWTHLVALEKQDQGTDDGINDIKYALTGQAGPHDDDYES